MFFESIIRIIALIINFFYRNDVIYQICNFNDSELLSIIGIGIAINIFAYSKIVSHYDYTDYVGFKRSVVQKYFQAVACISSIYYIGFLFILFKSILLPANYPCIYSKQIVLSQIVFHNVAFYCLFLSTISLMFASIWYFGIKRIPDEIFLKDFKI